MSMDAPSGGRTTDRLPEYDLVRIISIALVVLIHVIAPFVRPEGAALGGVGPVALLSRLLRFAVPAFIMLTGALVWTRPVGGGRDGWWRFFSRRGAAVAVPYLFWSAVFIAVGVLLDVRSLGSFKSILRGLALGTTWYHLYFVPVVLGMYALAPLASALYRRSVLFLLAGAVTLGIFVPAAIADRGLVESAPFALVSLVCAYLPYAAIGAWYARVRTSAWWTVTERWCWPAFLVVGLGLRVWFTLLDAPPESRYVVTGLTIAMNVLPSLGVLGVARVIVAASSRAASGAVAWAPVVFGVYLVHPLVLLALERTAARFSDGLLPVWIWAPVAWPLVTVMSAALARVLVRHRSLWWLHGVVSRSAPKNQAGALTSDE